MSYDDKLDAILDGVNGLKKAVYGNGRPGLMDRMTVIETNQINCPAREAYRGDAKRASLANVIALGAMLIALASAFGGCR